jgi:ribosomal protein S4
MDQTAVARQSEYGYANVTEKQKLRLMYGLNERQFRNLFVTR